NASGGSPPRPRHPDHPRSLRRPDQSPRALPAGSTASLGCKLARPERRGPFSPPPPAPPTQTPPPPSPPPPPPLTASSRAPPAPAHRSVRKSASSHALLIRRRSS